MLNIDLKFSITPQEIDLDLDKIQEVTEVVTETILENDHTKLINRDIQDQHPIKAISGLESSLDEINQKADSSKGEIATVTRKLNTAEGEIDVIQGDIQQINSSLATKMEGEAMTNSDIAAVWNSVMGSN